MCDGTVKIFNCIVNYGHDEDFDPKADRYFYPTSAPPGSVEKINVLADRVKSGHPLWHKDDRADYAGIMTGLPVANRVHDRNRIGGIRVCVTPKSGKGFAQ